ncbi:HDOD domain-containing protein [Blastococcus tunisiensis]|uniref:HD-like signal output (HDOD) domain, no enzymatic activity n=1 Tax=Blastococcus tunisiensis TaxID=1798228 RepID=A0A1I2LAW4_9ACTN|nr:HDOD domain-containing protein [Blastococcus sp. DSM 46838]SFF74331.1 HD-like signal output (HDOD) domain, no enzymatic activity [Blastococcus sp. DSM 46838]
MTVTPFPGADIPAPVFDIEVILAGIDTMAVQKPVAAQIISVANSDDTDAKTLARILSSDIALAGRVMKLANSAYFGMRGRVTSLQFAVTVVGFTTVRTMATVALTDLDDESRLPGNFWDLTTSLALGASTLAPRFGERPPDSLCLGLLAQLGAALLHHNDPEGYAEIVAAHPTFRSRRAAETRRYGINSLRLTAVALEQWGFPAAMTTPLKEIDDYQTMDGALLRAAFEVAARLTIDDYEDIPIARLTLGRLREDDLVPILDLVRSEAAELKYAMLGQPVDDPEGNPDGWVF